ncbi:metallothionein-2-like isoform X2 [Thrips palmi]|uniref:Metallothionein-2-like isoform X2 n=1 Tax=Thrips palmi TaxID=161013 RepID=A0A6P8ZZR8_THRPL|nr:metallothionein-2-like isoform X2 [Thrips palmi]
MPNPCDCCKKACPKETCQCKCGENCNCGTDCKCCTKTGDAKGCCSGKQCSDKKA